MTAMATELERVTINAVDTPETRIPLPMALFLVLLSDDVGDSENNNPEPVVK